MHTIFIRVNDIIIISNAERNKSPTTYKLGININIPKWRKNLFLVPTGKSGKVRVDQTENGMATEIQLGDLVSTPRSKSISQPTQHATTKTIGYKQS